MKGRLSKLQTPHQHQTVRCRDLNETVNCVVVVVSNSLNNVDDYSVFIQVWFAPVKRIRLKFEKKFDEKIGKRLYFCI